MSWGIWMRWEVAGRIPASNMYESLLFLGWGVGAFAVIATVLLRNRIVVLNAAAGAALTMALTDLLPIDRFIHPMPPVLSGTYWLAIHVPIIMVGYAVLALGMVVAHMQIGVEAFAPARRSVALKMAELQYFYIHIGSILLVAGILTGSMWAASSWGRYWGGTRRRSGRSWPSSPTSRSCTRGRSGSSVLSGWRPGASSPSRRS